MIEPESQLIVKKGGTAKFYCDAIPEEPVTWNFDLGPLPPEAYFINDDYNTLYIRNVRKKHQGYYECIGRYNDPPYYPLFAAKSFLRVRSN